MIGLANPWVLLGGIGLFVASVGGAFLYGQRVEHDHAAAQVAQVKDQLRDTSTHDERMMSTMAGTLGQSLAAALNQGDRAAAPILVGMHDALRQTPLAVDVRCVVPDSVREQAATLHGAAERAADAADTAGTAVAGGAQPAPAR